MKRIAFITDAHLQEETPKRHGADQDRNWKIVLQDIQQKGITEVIYGGDIGEVSALPYFFESLHSFDLTLILGNHDQYEDVSVHYGPSVTKGSDELYYYRDEDLFRYIFLDSSSSTISDEQLTFFKRALQTEKRILIFIHHPILAIDTPLDRKYPLINRDDVLHILQENDQPTTIFSGHYHMPDHQSLGKIEQYVTPAISYQIVKDADKITTRPEGFGYRIITLDGESLTQELVIFP